MSSTSVTIDPAQLPLDASGGLLLEVGRANLYHLLTKAFSSPLEMEAKHPEQLRQVIPDVPGTLREATLALARCWEDALNDRQALSLAYARLFLGPFEILSPPYASFYLEPDRRLMGDVSRHVAQAYAEAGLGPGSGPQEAPDHVALEWEFLYYLTYQFVATGEEHWIARRKTFLTDHVNHWMPRLGKDILDADQHAFYNALAVLLIGVLEA